MAINTPATGSISDYQHAQVSAVSWGAIFAGAVSGAALSLILVMLGLGLGLTAVSPWAHEGVSGTTFGVSAIIWLTLTQLVAAGMGGYLAGRLRTRWVAVPADEVYFRDSAHGFLAWALAALLTASLLGSAIGNLVAATVRTGATIAGAAGMTGMAGAGGATATVASDTQAQANGEDGATAYLLDSLFRRAGDAPNGAVATDPARQAEEVRRIMMNTIRTGDLPEQERQYLARLVSQRTGLTQQQAEARVTETYSILQKRIQEVEIAAREAADQARQASSYMTLWMFISLLIGAFSASVAAIWGGRQRDR